MDRTLEYQTGDFEITISIQNPQIKGEALKYVVYTVKGRDKLGEIHVIRRYSDFDKTRDVLVSKWPGCYVPSLPEKKTVGNLDAAFIEERRRGLTFFVESVSKINHLWYSEEMQLLLKNPSQDIEKPLAAIGKVTTGQIILRYTQKFPHIREKVIGPDDVAKVTLFENYLKKSLPVLQSLIDMTKNNLSTRKKYNQQAEALISYLLPEYQKNCLKEYIPDANQEVFVFYGHKDQIIEQQAANMKAINQKTDMDLVYQGLRLQKREIEAFVEAIKVKEDYQNQYLKSKQKLQDLEEQKSKMSAGKTTFSSLIKTKSKQEIAKDLTVEITEAEKEQNNLAAIIEVATGLLTLIEIDKFKKVRQQSYYDLVKKSSQFELNIAKAENDLWKSILKSDAMSKADPS